MSTLDPILPRGFKRLLTGTFVPLAASCVPMKYPESTHLCRVPQDPPGWNQPGPDRHSPLLHRAQVGSREADYSLLVTPVYFVSGMDTGTYWVKLYARFMTPHQPELKQPMLYQPDAAWIEINGTRTPASGVVQFSEGDLRRPAAAIAWPVDLLALPRPADPASGALIMGFPVTWPTEPKDHWTVHLGAIKFGSEVVEIPDLKSCFTPGGTTWVPIFGAAT